MHFADLDSAIAWAKTKVPEDRANSAAARFAEQSEKHGDISVIHGGLNFYPGHSENEYGPGPAVPPLGYVWLRATWLSSKDDGKEYHCPIRLKMERDFTPEEWRQAGIG
jgi:hypothetical protein